MVSFDNLVAEAVRFRDMRNRDQVLDALEDGFRSLGAMDFLATGMPLPGRSIDPLVIRCRWGGARGERQSDESVREDDPVFAHALRLTRAEVMASPPESSSLYRAAAANGQRSLVIVPVVAFHPFQAVVVGAGPGFELDRVSLLALGYFCEEAFRQLLALRAVSPERPGDLSGRERSVVALSAEGKTASDIATELAISQRTVHAHLQNASDKLRARNKTQTVVEALRYGQISL